MKMVRPVKRRSAELWKQGVAVADEGGVLSVKTKPPSPSGLVGVRSSGEFVGAVDSGLELGSLVGFV